MAPVQGHSIDEQWDLALQFESLVEHAVAETVETYVALATGRVLAAAAGFDSTTPSVYTIWQKQVDTSLGPFVYATFESAALNVAHGVINTVDLPLGHGVPLISDDFTAGYVAQVKNQMVGVSDDLWSNINQELQKGVAANGGVEELADRIRAAGSITMPRAQTVARTTVVQASNAGSLSQARLLGDDTVTKEWLATEDARTRPAHAHADGQKQPLAKPFEVGGFHLMYPGDPSGPAGEVINCRCTLVYNFAETTTVLHICECMKADAVLAAVVPATSCVCPVTASLKPSGYVSPVSSYGDLAKAGLYKQFQSPSKISPAYGGAKIHKQLQPIKNALNLTDADNEALLRIMDEQYALAGGKSSFAEKYEEWLSSPAGQKVVKVPLSVPVPVPSKFITPSVSPLTAPPVVVTPGSNLTAFESGLDAADKTNIVHTLQNLDDFMTKSGLTFDQAWSFEKFTIDNITGLKGLTQDEQAALLKAYLEKHHPATDLSKWPGGAPTTPLATPTIVPTIVAPATVTAPASVDLLDISTVTDAQVQELAAKFKAIKPVTPNWGGSAVMKTLQEAKKALGPDFAKFNDGQLLKMLDQASGAAGKTGKTFYGETESWLKTPAGQKYVTNTGLPSLPTPGLVAVPVVPVTAPVVGALGDISGIDSVSQGNIFSAFKAQGLYVSSPAEDVWDAIQVLKKNATYAGYSDLQLVRVLDVLDAQKATLANKNIFEKKLVTWMKTKPGQDHMAGIVPVKKVVPAPVTPVGPTASVHLVDIPRNISTTEKVFTDISTTDAQIMQSGAAPWTAEQSKSLEYYTGSAYSSMNGALRYNMKVSSAVAKHIKNAQAAMRPSTRPLTLYRGTGPTQLGLKDGATEADYRTLIGKPMEDKGFMSTAVGDGRGSFSGDVKLVIDAPTGSPMAFVKSISQHPGEDEMLLAAGTRYRVTSVTRTGSFTTGFSIVVRVRIIP